MDAVRSSSSAAAALSLARDARVFACPKLVANRHHAACGRSCRPAAGWGSSTPTYGRPKDQRRPARLFAG